MLHKRSGEGGAHQMLLRARKGETENRLLNSAHEHSRVTSFPGDVNKKDFHGEWDVTQTAVGSRLEAKAGGEDWGILLQRSFLENALPCN